MKHFLFPALLAAATVAPASPASAQQANSRPNILLIVSEDHGPELGCYGDPFARTPILDGLASAGARFSRAYVTQAGCSPSRAGIHTGLYNHQNGQVALATWGFRMYHEDTPNLPSLLKQAGYRTGMIGKLHINPESAFPFDFRAIPGGNFQRRDLPAYADNALKFLLEGNDPFFLVVNYPEAHDPFLYQVDGIPENPLLPEDIEMLPYFGVDTPQLRKELAGYYNCLARLDHLVGELLDRLRVTGHEDNTLVIFVSDHGPDLIRGKRTCYEGGVHVPMIARWPGQIPAGTVRHELMSTVDIMPTLLDLAGAPPVPGLPGRSAVELFRNRNAPWRSHVVTQYHTHGGHQNLNIQRAIRDDRYKLIHNLMPGRTNLAYIDMMKQWHSVPPAAAAVGGDVHDTYERYRTPPEFELYDLQEDPREFRNLAGNPAYAAQQASLLAALNAWRVQTNDPFLDPALQQRFIQEVLSQTNKREARRHDWQYPTYLSPRNRPAARLPDVQ